MKLKNINIWLFALVIFGVFSCDSMEDNYNQYLENPKVYSPKVTDLNPVSGLRECTISWKNPDGHIAVKNILMLNDSVIYPADTLVSTYHFTNLEIKGYTISVYTVDRYNNYSIPATVNIFPNGE